MHMLCWLLESKERKWAKAAAKETNGQGNHKTVCKCLQTEITYDHLWSFMIIFIHFLFFELQHFCVWDEKTIDVTSGAVLFDFSPLFKNSSASGSNVGTWTGAREVLALSENSDRLSQISIRSSDLFFFATLGVGVTLRSKAFAAWRGYIQEQKRQLHQEEFKRNSLWWLFYLFHLVTFFWILLDSFDLCEFLKKSFYFLEFGGDPKKVRCRPRSSKLHCKISGNPSDWSFWCANPKTSGDHWDHRKQEIVWELAIYGLWQSMAVYDVYGRSKDSSHILLQISTFCIFSTFLPVDFDIFDLPWPSFSNPSIWLWHLWLPGELVSILCTSYVVWLCVYSTFVCFVHGWRSKGNRFTDVYRCLQFTVWLYFGANGMCVCVFHDSVALRRLA